MCAKTESIFHKRMDDNFSKFQKEMHLPSSTNEDVNSPENIIISYGTPSVYRYAWYSTREYSLVADKVNKEYIVPDMSNMLVDIKMIKDPNVKSLSLVYRENEESDIVLQRFDKNLIDYFSINTEEDVLSLDWFFRENDKNGILYRYIPQDEKIVLRVETDSDDLPKASAVFRQQSLAERAHMIHDADKRTILAKIWVPLSSIGENYDSLLSILILNHDEDNITIKQGDDIIVDTDTMFLTKYVNGMSWTRWNNYADNWPFHPGIPLNNAIDVNGLGEKYALVYKILNI